MEKVEHENLIRTAVIERRGANTYAIIDEKRHKVYPTGDPQEPWTTNISYASSITMRDRH